MQRMYGADELERLTEFARPFVGAGEGTPAAAILDRGISPSIDALTAAGYFDPDANYWMADYEWHPVVLRRWMR